MQVHSVLGQSSSKPTTLPCSVLSPAAVLAAGSRTLTAAGGAWAGVPQEGARKPLEPALARAAPPQLLHHAARQPALVAPRVRHLVMQASKPPAAAAVSPNCNNGRRCHTSQLLACERLTSLLTSTSLQRGDANSAPAAVLPNCSNGWRCHTSQILACESLTSLLISISPCLWSVSARMCCQQRLLLHVGVLHMLGIGGCLHVLSASQDRALNKTTGDSIY